ncbi:hypothetical protein ANAPC1_01453 [Anaplasma phagocytophilum]|uniref:Uncharacterized protein n=1 Tax=Anaplasma phagocytophilum TaxID=948 RepID=A0AA45UV76_ANAPH|nr:hypothetical protein ANAPC1_01453 [Anaplasma phagocytophilum]SBO33308.1 hypothetical protein ANAPC2_01317 [Anaplasma phagocytophilum]SBO33760.1 hypothetical protein ANAPC3_01343 [Anaplasma phagocytophilum]SBO33794.1 hypothetical protein ANAPC4_01296 [Anaplasma phagocytophilum]
MERRGAYLNSAFVNAELSGQSFSGRYPRVGVLLKERLQGVLLARLQNEPPPSRSCGDGACGRREEREAPQTRAPGGGLDGGAQACSPPRAVAPVPEQSREPGDGVCIWKSLGYSPTARLRGKGR